jgi:2-polyprenyl-6-methoxyphenol hydroxylase-like FAD-dependent oxidoreductase
MTGSGAVHDVVIVGGGVAGGVLATALARAGKDVLLLEKSETYADRVRGEAMLQWGVKEAQNLGLYDPLVAAGGNIIARSIAYDELAPAEAVEAAPGDMTQFIPGVPGILGISHPRHCQTLLDQARAAGATVRRGVEIAGLEAGAAPSVTFESGGEKTTARARLVVGADGRPSAVREALGIPMSIGAPRNMAAGLRIAGAPGWAADLFALGTEGDFCFSVFPQGNGEARVYGWWPLDQRHRFAGKEGLVAFFSAFRLGCCPMASAIAEARADGPLMSFLNNESVAETPYTEGAVLIGDAAGWTDPLSGCGLSSAYRDARIVSEIIIASDDWSAAAFAPYAEERNERLRRLRFVTEIETALQCDFSERGRARRGQFFARAPSDPSVLAHIVANLAGPDAQPATAFTPEHRAFVLGEA